MTKPLSERYLELVLKKYNPKNAIWEDIVFGDIVYISTDNWNTMMAGNKSLKRYPSDDYIKRLEPNFVNKTLGKIMDAYENGMVDVKFNDKTFRLNSAWLSKLKGNDGTKDLEEAIKISDTVEDENDIGELKKIFSKHSSLAWTLKELEKRDGKLIEIYKLRKKNTLLILGRHYEFGGRPAFLMYDEGERWEILPDLTQAVEKLGLKVRFNADGGAGLGVIYDPLLGEALGGLDKETEEEQPRTLKEVKNALHNTLTNILSPYRDIVYIKVKNPILILGRCSNYHGEESFYGKGNKNYRVVGIEKKYTDNILTDLKNDVEALGLKIDFTADSHGGGLGYIYDPAVNEALGGLDKETEEEDKIEVGDVVKLIGPMSEEEYKENYYEDDDKYGHSYNSYLQDNLYVEKGEIGKVKRINDGRNKIFIVVDFKDNKNVDLFPEEVELVSKGNVNEARGDYFTDKVEDEDNSLSRGEMETFLSRNGVRGIIQPSPYIVYTYNTKKDDIVLGHGATVNFRDTIMKYPKNIETPRYKNGVLKEITALVETKGWSIKYVLKSEVSNAYNGNADAGIGVISKGNVNEALGVLDPETEEETFTTFKQLRHYFGERESDLLELKDVDSINPAFVRYKIDKDTITYLGRCSRYNGKPSFVTENGNGYVDGVLKELKDLIESLGLKIEFNHDEQGSGLGKIYK